MDPGTGPSPSASPTARSRRSTARSTARWRATGSLRLPIVRGVVALGESLTIGFRALTRLRELRGRRGARRATSEAFEIGRWTIFFSFAVAIGFVDRRLQGRPGADRRQPPDQERHLLRARRGADPRSRSSSATWRSSRLIPSLKRVFQYHAAEHKAINAYEAGEELTPEVTQRYSLIHPRCGTAVPLLGDGDRRLRLRALRQAPAGVARRSRGSPSCP